MFTSCSVHSVVSIWRTWALFSSGGMVAFRSVQPVHSHRDMLYADNAPIDRMESNEESIEKECSAPAYHYPCLVFRQKICRREKRVVTCDLLLVEGQRRAVALAPSYRFLPTSPLLCRLRCAKYLCR